MSNLMSLISDISLMDYDSDILNKEINTLDSILDNNNLLLKKQSEYRDIYLLLSEKFAKEFKALNEQHYKMRTALKSIRLDLNDEYTKRVVIDSEIEVLNNIKNIFQTILNTKQKTINTYILLDNLVENFLFGRKEFTA